MESKEKPTELEQDFREYCNYFVQYSPKHAEKTTAGWRTRQYSLTDKLVKAHLNKERTIAGVAPWYPRGIRLDVDRKKVGLRNTDNRAFAEKIRADLGMDESNSMLDASETPGSLYVHFLGVFNGKPLTRYQLNEKLKIYCADKDIELWPQRSKCGRLPFGKYSKQLDYETYNDDTWQEKLHSFRKLNDFELSNIKWQQFELPFTARTDKFLPLISDAASGSGWYAQGYYYLRDGLQVSGTRNNAQARVIYYFFQNNVDFQEAINKTWQWIKKKHNGFSETILKHPEDAYREIKSQVAYIYNHYQWRNIYPNATHNTYFGYISKEDLETILRVNKGSIPRSKLLSGIVKYCNPRRHREWVNIRTGTQWADRDKGYSADTLRDMGGKGTITKYMREFEEKGILKRSKRYFPGKQAKGLKLNWEWKTDKDGAILHAGRSIDSWENTIKNAFSNPRDFRELLRTAGTDKSYMTRILRGIYG